MRFAAHREVQTAPAGRLTDNLAGPMPSQKSKRKRRNPSSAPRAVPSQRREQRAERVVVTDRERRRSETRLGTKGERPPSPFGGLPVSEVAIFAGLVALVVGLINGGTAALAVGAIVCSFGVLEVTGREHFSGYRSHTTLLAAVPAVALEAGLFAVGVRPRERVLLLLVVVPVFALGFWWLRKRFTVARQARVARPPAPRAPAD
jgi:hypothetical protein